MPRLSRVLEVAFWRSRIAGPANGHSFAVFFALVRGFGRLSRFSPGKTLLPQFLGLLGNYPVNKDFSLP
jgi:hypothetical protein